MKNFLRMANGEWRITATFRAIRHLLSSILVSNPPRHPLALGLASETRPGAPESRRLRAPGFLFGLLAAGFWLLASAPAAPAAVMYGIFTNSVGNADTNSVKLIQLSGPTANADGSFNTVGLPIRVTPAADGRWTNTLVTGNWLVTNSFLGKGIAFRAPLDNGPTPHNIYSNLISGYNTYVTLVFGTNPPPTYDEITNALGILPLTPAQVTNAAAQQALYATNTLNTHLQNTNSALVTRLNATNDLILARIEATNLLTRAALTATNDLIIAQIVIAASTNGVSATTATNIAAYQAKLATNTIGILGLAQSNSLLAYLQATNTSLLGKVNADSNSLLAYLLATNVSLRTFATNAAVYQAALATNDLAASLAGKLGTNAPAARVASAVTNQWKLDATNAAWTAVNRGRVTNDAFTLYSSIINPGEIIFSVDADGNINSRDSGSYGFDSGSTVIDFNGFSGDGSRLSEIPFSALSAVGRLAVTNAAAQQAALATNALAASLAGKLGTNEAAARVTSAVTNQWKLDATNAALTHAALVTNNLPALLAAKVTTNAPLWRAATNDLSSATNIAFNGLAPDTRQTITNIANSSSGTGIATLDGRGTNTTLTFDHAQWGTNNTLLPAGSSNAYIFGGAGSKIISTNTGSLLGNGGYNVIVAGLSNRIATASSPWSASGILAGQGNTIGQAANTSIIGGGFNNTIAAVGISAPVGSAFLGAGVLNTIGVSAGGSYSFLGSGLLNILDADFGAIPGGRENMVAAGADYAFAAGYGASASNSGTFVWADAQGTTFGSVISNSFLVRAQNGVAINTNDPSGHAVKVIGNVDSSSGTAGRYTATNFSVGGNALATTRTNYLALRGAGTTSANGSYTWTGSLYTNKITTGYVVLIAGVWYAKSADGTINYSASGSVSNGAWTQVSGSLPVPASTFGSAFNLDGNVWEGAISSTNFEARLAAITAGVWASLTDATNAAQTVVSNAKTNLGTFNTFTNITPGMTNSYSALHNGALWLSPARVGGAGNNFGGSINWLNYGQTVANYSEGSGNSPLAKIAFFDNWGDVISPNNGVIKVTAGNLRFENNWGGSGMTVPGYVMLGNEDSFGSININYLSHQHRATIRGRSYPVVFTSVSTDAVTNHTYSAATIQGYVPIGWTNNLGGVYNPSHLGFFSLPVIPNTLIATNALDTYPGWEVGRIETNGWNLRGNLLQELATPTWTTTNVALDFKSGYGTTIDLASTAIQTNRFYTTNRTTVSYNSANTQWKNFEQREFRILSGALDRYLLWPTNWSSVLTTLPATLPAQQVLRLSVQSWGEGESNITVSAAIGADNSFAFDPDAAIFFTAASISDSTQKAAVDYLAKATKATGLWPKITALYPFVGGNSNANALNLRGPTSNNIVYSASGVTHDANGITGNGSTGYGVSAYIASGATDYSNQHVIVYCRTTLPSPDQCRFVSVATAGGATRMGVYRDGTVVAIDGPQNANAGASSLAVSSDFRGFIGLSRLDANNYYALSASLTNSFSVPAVNAPQTLGYGILCRNYAGTGITSHSDANLAFVSLGYGLTATELQVYRAIVNQYEAILGRNVP